MFDEKYVCILIEQQKGNHTKGINSRIRFEGPNVNDSEYKPHISYTK